MTSRSRRQTRSRRFGPGVWAPYEHNRWVAERKALRRSLRSLRSSAQETSAAFEKLGFAAEAFTERAADTLAEIFTAASLATGGFATAWVIREKTEMERTRSHAEILGMDEVDADRMIEDFRLTQAASPSSPGGIRAWEDLRDEITDHVLGFGAARLIS